MTSGRHLHGKRPWSMPYAGLLACAAVLVASSWARFVVTAHPSPDHGPLPRPLYLAYLAGRPGTVPARLGRLATATVALGLVVALA